MQRNFAQEIKQNGKLGHLNSTVIQIIVATHVYQTKTSRSCWSFVTHCRSYPLRKVKYYELKDNKYNIP